jgi:hypothetical protein
MSEVILVYLSQPQTAPQLLWAAEAITRAVGHVRFEVMAIRIPPETTILPTEQILSQEDCARIRRKEADRTEYLRRIYDRWTREIADAGHHSDWIDIEGLAGREVARRGITADLIVIDRLPKPVNQLAKDVAHAALFDCHRPVLVIPPGLRRGGTLGEHVAIAWKDDGRAIKAVIPAMRYFSGAKDTTALMGYRGSAPPVDLPQPLVEREIDARLYPVTIGSDPFGQTLLERAQGLGADILVMGAYAHSPLQEMLFGGVTRYVLNHAELPVLMRH